MKDFDEELVEDRTFKLAGETFTWKYIRPETLFNLADDLQKQNGANDGGLSLLDAQVTIFLNEGDLDRWKSLRERDENPVTLGQLTTLVEWLVEAQSGRPTETPAPSVTGRGKTGGSSRAA